jgi:dsRNA-specific ribonuclease
MDNSFNKLITREYVEKIINSYNSTFAGSAGRPEGTNEHVSINDLELYQRAMTHESYFISVQNTIKNGNGTECPKVFIDYVPYESSERLEFLGDHILKAIMGTYLYQRFPEEREGFLTRLKIKIEKSSMLHKFGLTLGFKDYLLLSSQVEAQSILGEDRGRHTPNYYENAFEAFIGAMFSDLGYIITESFVRGVIERIIDFSDLIVRNDNFKDSIQRYYQSIKFQTPTYKSISEDGPLYRKIFTRAIWIDDANLSQLSDIQQKSIRDYTKSVIDGFKIRNGKVFLKLMDMVSQNNYIVGIGVGKKVTIAEQEAAREGLLNLGLDLNY